MYAGVIYTGVIYTGSTCTEAPFSVGLPRKLVDLEHNEGLALNS